MFYRAYLDKTHLCNIIHLLIHIKDLIAIILTFFLHYCYRPHIQLKCQYAVIRAPFYSKCVSDAPRFTHITGNVNVIANGVNKLKLICTTDSSNPTSTITWYMDGKLVNVYEGMTNLTGSYGTSHVHEFAPTPGMDGHVVECSASNAISVKDVSSSVTLDLKCKYTPIIVLKFNTF